MQQQNKIQHQIIPKSSYTAASTLSDNEDIFHEIATARAATTTTTTAATSATENISDNNAKNGRQQTSEETSSNQLKNPPESGASKYEYFLQNMFFNSDSIESTTTTRTPLLGEKRTNVFNDINSAAATVLESENEEENIPNILSEFSKILLALQNALVEKLDNFIPNSSNNIPLSTSAAPASASSLYRSSGTCLYKVQIKLTDIIPHFVILGILYRKVVKYNHRYSDKKLKYICEVIDSILNVSAYEKIIENLTLFGKFLKEQKLLVVYTVIMIWLFSEGRMKQLTSKQTLIRYFDYIIPHNTPFENFIHNTLNENGINNNKHFKFPSKAQFLRKIEYILTKSYYETYDFPMNSKTLQRVGNQTFHGEITTKFLLNFRNKYKKALLFAELQNRKCVNVSNTFAFINQI